ADTQLMDDINTRTSIIPYLVCKLISYLVRNCRMKIATCNVNGIRARAAQVCEFLEREKPDVLCLQELKAGIEQVPEQCKTDGYHIYWHGSTLRAYSGVSLHVKKGVAEPAFSHPDFDMESRIVAARSANLVLASVYVPNGGKDYPAKLAFMRQLGAWAQRLPG